MVTFAASILVQLCTPNLMPACLGNLPEHIVCLQEKLPPPPAPSYRLLKNKQTAAGKRKREKRNQKSNTPNLKQAASLGCSAAEAAAHVSGLPSLYLG